MTARKEFTRGQLKALRTAVADYMQSEGCSCCRDYEAHEKHHEALGRLLQVRPVKDGEGLWFDFSKYRTKGNQP